MIVSGSGGTDSPTLDGSAMHALVRELYPVCRAVTGNGVRQTLRRLAESVPLAIHEVPSGMPVLDWVVPDEWNIREAWIATTDGRRVVDFQSSSLHVMSYSRAIRARLSREELERHLHSLPGQPDLIPYGRGSYTADAWGFCLTERQRAAMTDSEYDVCIDSTAGKGSLTYGECLVPGRARDEVLLSTHVCHPSLANDNLSGIVVLAAVMQRLLERPRRLTYRALFAPGTIGSITWLGLHEPEVRHIRHGLVLTCLGDPGGFTYKRSRHEQAEIDRTVAHVLHHRGGRYEIRPFSPDGYDERQYCSPGFNLPVGRLTRTPNGEYPEYHTSADDPDLLRTEALAGSVEAIVHVLDALEANGKFTNLVPMGEPQLRRRGVFQSLEGAPDARRVQQALPWVLNLSDGRHNLLDIAERSGMSVLVLRQTADLLASHGLLVESPSA